MLGTNMILGQIGTFCKRQRGPSPLSIPPASICAGLTAFVWWYLITVISHSKT